MVTSAKACWIVKRTYLSVGSESRQNAHHVARASQLSSHEDCQLIICARCLIAWIYGARNTNSEARGVGTVVTNSMSVGGDCTTGLVAVAELTGAVKGICRIFGFGFKSFGLDDMQLLAGDLAVIYFTRQRK
jgi:hypothetical protein